uniref:ATP synthase F0 subunit 6 n=1 Tax=Tetragonula iridipennis TaxID=597212 RepID=UPI0026E242C7|nr:ATP synthase F0 subunit 6 [Tetragonula iridipennis]WJQ22756.1 ATP synthase subunit 6 [Tetragonula iridipennis]
MKMVMFNLFESFDPSVYYLYTLQLNWLFSMYSLILLTSSYWLIPSRLSMVFTLIFSILFSEFSMASHYKKLAPGLLVLISLMFYTMSMNFLSLFPYIFSTTSHLLFNLSLSLPLWMSFFLYSIITNPMKFFSHLVPYNSPGPLMNFMVIIEMISYLIRPLTLSIRLSSNLLSGHLILILLSSFVMKFVYTFPVSMMVENLLLVLEISMSVIQAYVFSVLLALYLKESI